MDSNNNTTTVGGVTFGGGNNNSSDKDKTSSDTKASGAENTPTTSSVPLASSTQSNVAQSNTADDNSAESVNNPTDNTAPGATNPTDRTTPVSDPTPTSAPSQPAPAGFEPFTPQPAGFTKVDAEPVVPVQASLNVPFVSPTGFDTQNTVHPFIKNPSAPNIPEPTDPKTMKSEKKKNETPEQALKKFTTLTLVFGILSVVFLAVGIIGIVLAAGKSDELERTQAKLNNANNIIRAVEESAEVGTISSPADVPVYKATTGYIYISEWGIKIKIPDNLEKVSYILNQNYRPSICFNAVGKGVQYFPDFANIGLNPGHMGCLTRIATSEGSFDAASGRSFGELVFTNKDYNYFYTGPIDYSDPENDVANLGLEHTAQTLIKSMLTDNIESYE